MVYRRPTVVSGLWWKAQLGAASAFRLRVLRSHRERQPRRPQAYTNLMQPMLVVTVLATVTVPATVTVLATVTGSATTTAATAAFEHALQRVVHGQGEWATAPDPARLACCADLEGLA